MIAGNGPLCLQTAAELIDGGANVVAVLEAAPPPGSRQLARAAAGGLAAIPCCWLKGIALPSRLPASCTGAAA